MSIKAGDLVMVVKPTDCCNASLFLGRTSKVAEIGQAKTRCPMCGDLRFTASYARAANGAAIASTYRLIKIDPPATGDSLPTRKDMKEPA